MKISKAADELLYLNKSKTDLIDFAQKYSRLVKDNRDKLAFFPSIETEIKQSLEKKNFTIANAHDKINTLAGILPKIDYIKSSLKSYDLITDSELLRKADLVNFKHQVVSDIAIINISSIDTLYKKVVDKYSQINSANQLLGSIRVKYESLKKQISDNLALLNYFPAVLNELTSFINSTTQDEFKVDFYLNSIIESLGKLNLIKNRLTEFENYKKDDIRVIESNITDYFDGLAKKIDYKGINNHLLQSNNFIQQTFSKIEKLKKLRNRYASISQLLLNNKSNVYSKDYVGITKEVKNIEDILFQSLNTDFEDADFKLNETEKLLNSATSYFSTIQQNTKQLLSFLNNNKVKYWSEDYNILFGKIEQYKNNNSGLSYNSLQSELNTLCNNKETEIHNFKIENSYFLSVSGLQNELTSRIQNAFVSKAEFQDFITGISKGKGLKLFFYRVKDLLRSIIRFIFKPSSLKVGGIILATGLGIAFVYSYWQYILFVGFVVFITSILLKK